jgi:hypothetical protein
MVHGQLLMKQVNFTYTAGADIYRKRSPLLLLIERNRKNMAFH